MSDVLIFDNKSKDKVISVNSLNELLYSVKGEKTDIIYKNVSADFDVIAEESGAISILAVTLSGSLVFFKFLNGEWKKYTVLDSRSGGKKINAVKMLKINGRIHAFYCISYDGRMMLIHHIFEGTDFSREPQVVDYIGLRCAYSVCTDDSWNIHIMYSDENASLKYTVFSNSQKRYSASAVISEEEVRSINCVFSDNTVFAAYLSREHEYNVINCVRADNGEKHTVGFGVDSLSEPCIFTDGFKIYVQWCERGNSFECSAGFDFRFSKPVSIGQNAGILRVRCLKNESLAGINKCAGNKRGVLASAEGICRKFTYEKEPNFEAKGAQIEKFAQENKDFFDEKYINAVFERQIYELEQRVAELEKFVYGLKNADRKDVSDLPEELTDVGEIDEENLAKFKGEETNGVNSDDTEYNETVNSANNESEENL